MTDNKIRTKVDELKDALEKVKGLENLEKGRSREGQKVKEARGRGAVDAEKSRAEERKAGAQELDELTSQLTTAEEEAKAHYDKLLRVTAELDNFKKRSVRERQELVKFSNEQLITELLPVADALDKVLEHLPEGASKDLTDFVVGVQLVAKQFLTVLNKYGLEEIKAAGEKFNPEFHEAVAHVPSDCVGNDFIVEVHRKGYMLNSRVIRAAMVSVSKGGAIARPLSPWGEGQGEGE